MEQLILSELCSALDTNILDLDLQASFIQNGGHSLAAATFASRCEARGYHITSRSILTSHSIRDCISSARDINLENPKQMAGTSIKRNGDNASASPHESHLTLKNEKFVSLDQVAPAIQSSQFSLLSRSENVDNPRDSSTASDVSISEARSEAIAVSSESAIDDEDEPKGALTEMQLSLIHGTLKTRGMNIISYSETYFTKDVSTMREAWKTVIGLEPIFHIAAFEDFRTTDHDNFSWHEETSLFTDKQTRKAVDSLRNTSGIGSAFHVFPQTVATGKTPLSVITWIVHHAFVDGFSASLLLDKVRRVTADMTVKPSPSFSQVAADLQRLRKLKKLEGDDYWSGKTELLNSASSQLMLPAVTLASVQPPCDEVVIDIKSLREGFKSFSKEANVTPATIFNAAWALTLSKYCDSMTVKFGSILSGRDLPFDGVRETIGPLMNTLPVCIMIDPGLSAKSFAREMMFVTTELREFQWTTQENGFSNDFESALAVQFNPAEPPKYAVKPIGEGITHQATEIPLSIMVEQESKIRFTSRRDRFSRTQIEEIGSCYFRALQLILHHDMSLDGILQGLLQLSNRDMLLRYGNCISDRTTKASIAQDLVTLFEQSVQNVPNSLAIQKGDQSLTYAALDHAASRVASQLSKKIRPGDVVCVHSDRSMNWIVAIYGILKSGATYCSLDSGLPQELRESMFANAGAKVFVLPHAAEQDYSPASSQHSIAIDDILETTKAPALHSLSHRKHPVPWSAAYLCFTSGSTGTPKGVLCTHGGLVAFQSELEVRLCAQPGLKIAQVMSPAFDGSIHEIFSALSYSATLVLPMPDDPFGHLTSVDSALLTPSIARAIDPNNYPHLKHVYLVGEPVPQFVNDTWSKDKKLCNMYGPTEGTCGATIKRLTPGTEVTIGGPNPTTRVYILDHRFDLTLPGVVGEIYIAGIQVAKGYLNLPEANQERFLPDKVLSNGEMMYKTGDKGYWNTSGEVVCLGRHDRQIKLRGFRLDMNDLEIRVARAIPEVDAIAIFPQGEHLVAMVQPASLDVNELLSRISMVLPSYAVPRHLMATEALPTTRAGKIDYKTMSQTIFSASARKVRRLNTTGERIVAAAFKSVLELDNRTVITAHSNFLDLGGHSLQQLSLSLRLTRDFGLAVPLQLVIENPVLEKMANAISAFAAYKPRRDSSMQPLNDHGVSLIEQDWLKRYEFDAGSSCFNVSFTSTFAGGMVDRAKLTEAWNAVLARHPLLSCRYISRRGKAPQRIYTNYAPRVERVKRLDLWSEVNRPFQLDRSSPIRVSIAEDRVVAVLSHIIADYTTLAILLKEVSTLYNSQRLPAAKNHYLKTRRFREAAKPCYLDFWGKYLNHCEESPPLFGRRIERESYRGTSVLSLLPCATAAKIFAFVDSTSFTLQQLVTGAVALCIQRPEDFDTDVVIGTPHINRNSEEALATVGLFLQPLPIRVRYNLPSEPVISDAGTQASQKNGNDGNEDEPQKEEEEEDSNNKSANANNKPTASSSSSSSFLDSVRESSQAALAHAVPWHQLLDRLSIANSSPNHPLSDVMVSFHDHRRQQTSDLGIAAPGFEPGLLWSEGSKFKLMCEFTATAAGVVMLRLEYDPVCVRRAEVAMMQRCLPVVLGWLVDGWAYADVLKGLGGLREREEGDWETVLENRDLFGVGLREL